MAILTDKSKETLASQFEKLFKDNWKITPGLPTILSLHRKTGTNGGVYPELDAGDALKEINEIVTEIPANDGKSSEPSPVGIKSPSVAFLTSENTGRSSKTKYP